MSIFKTNGKSLLQSMYEVRKNNRPNTLINECIDAINEFINEEYGINDDLRIFINKLMYKIRQVIQTPEQQTQIQKGLIQRQKSLKLTSNDEIFSDLNKIIKKFKNLKLTLNINNFNFKNKQYYDEFIKNNTNTLDSITTFNNTSTTAFSTIYFNYISISGKPIGNAYSDLSHELSHYFQQLNNGGRYNNAILISKINSLLNSDNNIIKNIAKILYYCDNAEQDSVVNGLYGFIVNDENKEAFDIVKIEHEIKNDTALKWLIELKQLIKWAKSQDNNIVSSLMKENNLTEFKSINKLINYAEKKEKRFQEKIAKCVFKIKKDIGLVTGYSYKNENYFCHLNYDNELINENEDYFSPDELLTETKSYYVNMDVKIKEGERTAPKTTPSELEDEFKKVWDKYSTENEPYKLGRFVYTMLRYDNPANSSYKALKEFYKDMSKISVDSENIDPIGDIRTTKSGISYVLCNKHGDWENPVLFMVYFDGDNIRGYIPEYGNCFNCKERRAFGDSSDEDDKAFIKSQYPDKSEEEISTIQNHIRYNKDACIEDFEKHIKVKKSKVSESVELLNESLLLEANLDDIYAKYYSNIPQEEFWQIIQADPTYNPQKQQKMGKYGKWLLNLYKQNKLKTEDLYKATDYLSYFVKYYNKIEQKDINQIPDLPSLFNVIKPFKEASDNGEEMATSKSDEVRKIKQDAEKFYEDDTWLVVIPHSQEASCYYGKNTQRCTAATGSYNMFEHYNSEGLLYININKKTNKKYQFHFESNSFMDETDTPISNNISKTIGLSSGLLQAYCQKYGGRAIIALTKSVDWDEEEPIEGEEPYYLYCDYDDYYHIVQVDNINVVPCKGLPDEMTSENDPRYLGNGIFCFHNLEESGYYDEEDDYYYNTDEYVVSGNWIIYNAKTQKMVETDSNDIPYLTNKKYIKYDKDYEHYVVDPKTLQIIFKTNKLLTVLNYSMYYANNPVTYSYDLFFIRQGFNNNGNYDENVQLFDMAQQKVIPVPLPDGFKIGNYYNLNGQDYLTLKNRKVDMDGENQGQFKSVLIYPDGRLSEPFYNK